MVVWGRYDHDTKMPTMLIYLFDNLALGNLVGYDILDGLLLNDRR